jgi:hypothetical protein
VIPCRTKLWRPTPACEALYAELTERYNPEFRNAEGRDGTPYEILLKGFGSFPLRHPIAHEFLILLWQHQWEGDVHIENRGVLNHWLVRMAKGLCFFKRLVIMGCGSSGKTGIVSAYCYTRWKANPFNTSVFLSTTSAEAGENRAWGNVKAWHRLDRHKVGKCIDSLGIITLDEELRDEDGAKERDLRDVVKRVNIKPGTEGDNAVSSIVGRKNFHVIWHCDEYNFMNPGVLDARVNLNTNPLNQFIGTCNAPKEGDPAYMDATPFGDKYPDGWKSVDKDVDLSWPTERSYCLYFNGAKSPNNGVDGPPPFPLLMHEGIREDMEKDSGGIDSPNYWKQYFGFPPGADISDKLLTINLLQTNGAFMKPNWRDAEKKVLGGLDLGFRADGDPCVLQFGDLGMCAPLREDDEMPKFRKLLVMERDGIRLVPSQKSKDAFEAQIAKRVIEECRSRGCHDIALDVTGDGGILLQHIERESREQGYPLNVLPVSFSGTAEDRIVIPGEKRTAKEMFQNMVAQLWGTFRLSVLNKAILGMDPHSQCTKQLCARKMGTDDKKRLTVEPKKEMKKRLRRSPDNADAGALLNHLALKHGLAGIEIPQKPKPFNPDTILRPRQRSAYQPEHRSIYGKT